MTKWLKQYWAEIIVFTAIFGVFLLDLAPNMTWINTNSDGVHLTYAAKYLYPAHKGSAPIYLLLGHLALYFPIGTDFWRMGLLSAIPAGISAILIYLTIRKLIPEKSKWYAIIGSLVYGGSALVISQATIVKYYSLVTMVGLLAYLLCLNKKWVWASIMLGVAGAIHPISMFFILPIFIKYRELRSWKNIAISASFILFYLYVPITNRPPYMWEESNSKGLFGFIKDTGQTAMMLTGALSIWDLPKRILDTGAILLLSWSAGIIGILYYLWKDRIGKWYKDVVLWVMGLSIIYFATDLAPQTYVYLLPGVAFGCIAIGIGFSRADKVSAYLICIIAIIMLGVNANYFDIGRTLDKNLSATEFYEKELSKVPNSGIVLTKQAWEWAMIYPYNKATGKELVPVLSQNLSNEDYINTVQEMGVKLVDPSPGLDPNTTTGLVLLEKQNVVTTSVLNLNDNLWISYPTDKRSYGAAIVQISDKGTHWNSVENIAFAEKVLLQPVTDELMANTTKVKWNISNPYDFITGAIELSDWQLVTWSSYNCLVFGMLAVIGGIPCWILWQIVVKKKKWNIKEVNNKRKEVL